MSGAIQTITAPPVRARHVMAVACTSLGFFVVQLDGSILNVALPQIGDSLRVGVDGLQWAVDAYFLAFAAFLLSSGALSDRLGARRAFVSGFVLFSAASLACALSTTLTVLVMARALQGSGVAVLVPCSLSLLNNACGDDAAARAQAIGIWTAAGGVALAAGPVAGGVLVGLLGWWSIFLVNVPIGVIGIWMTVRFVDELKPVAGRGSLDLTGQILAVVSILGLVGAIIEIGRPGREAPFVIFGVLLATIAGGGFLITEYRAAEPLVPLEMFRHPIFCAAVLIGFVVNLVIFGLSFAFAIYFQRVLFYSPVATGLALLPFAMMVTVANLVGGRVAARVGSQLPMIVGLLVTAVGFVLLFCIGKTTTYLGLLPGQLLIRVGIGLVVPPMTTAVLATVDRARSGIASGILNATRQTGGAIGVALFGALMAWKPIPGMHIAFMVSASLLVLVAFVAIACFRSFETGSLKTLKLGTRS